MSARTADVVIIGGGCTGASLAYHLAVRGVRRILLLEKNFLASGGTGRSVGIVRQLYPQETLARMVLRSVEVFKHFREIVGGDAGYVRCGAILAVAADGEALLRRTAVMERSVGIKTAVLGPDDLRVLEPRIDWSAIAAAVYEEDSGYGDPTSTARAYAEAARERGAEIRQGVKVTGVRVEAGRVRGVITEADGEIAAPVVVNATGLWAARVARMVGAEIPVLAGRHPVFSVRRPPTFGPAHAVFLDLARGTYFRPETGELTVTGTLDSDESRHPVDADTYSDGVEFEEVERTLVRSFASMPALGEATFARAYAGAFDITPDWNPILGELPEAEGFYCAVGFSGHGFKLCPAVGDLMAQLIATGRTDLDLALFSPTRFAASTAIHGTFVSSYLRPSE